MSSPCPAVLLHSADRTPRSFPSLDTRTSTLKAPDAHHVACHTAVKSQREGSWLQGTAGTALWTTTCGITSGRARKNFSNNTGCALTDFYPTHHIPVIPLYQSSLLTDFHFRVWRIWQCVSDTVPISEMYSSRWMVPAADR